MKKLVVVVAAVALSFAASGIEIVGRMIDQRQQSAVTLQGRLNGRSSIRRMRQRVSRISCMLTRSVL